MPKKSMGMYRVAACSVLVVLAVGACVEAPPPAPPPQVVVVEGAEGRVIFEDDFSTYKPAWKQVRGKWALQDGQMRQMRDDPREQNSLMYVDLVDVADVEITTRVETYGGTSSVAGAGLVFRLRDENNYYMFRLAGSGVVFGKMVDGEWFDLANPRAADFRVDGRLDSVEPLRVKIVGNRVQCWVGSDSVVNMIDETFSTGKVGLVTFKATASFGFIKIVELGTT